MKTSRQSPGVSLPLTRGQLQLHHTMQSFPSALTALWTSYKISGPFDAAAFEAAVAVVVRRHEALRLIFNDEQAKPPEQWVADVPPEHLLVSWLRVHSASLRQFERYVRHVLASHMAKHWNPGRYPFKLIVLRYSDELHALLVGFSHMAVDGTGCDIVLRDIWRAYHSQPDTTGEDSTQPPKSFAAVTRSLAAINVKRSRRAGHDQQPAALRETPPITQFLTGDSPRTANTDHFLEFIVDDDVLTHMRAAVGEIGLTEFQLVFALWARTVFLFSPQDRIKFSVMVDPRGTDDRDQVGMFAVAIPVIVDRPATSDGAGFLSHVRKELFTAMIASERAGAEPQDLLSEDCDVCFGARTTWDLAVNYRMSVSDQPHLRPSPAVERDAYTPTINYSTKGISVDFLSTPDTLRLRATFSRRSFCPESAHRFITGFRNALTDVARHGTGSLMMNVPPCPAPDHVIALTDPQGKVIAWADPARVERNLEKHPAAVSAVVRSSLSAAGNTILDATVLVVGDVTEAELHDYLLDTGDAHGLVLAPQRISVFQTAGATQHRHVP